MLDRLRTLSESSDFADHYGTFFPDLKPFAAFTLGLCRGQTLAHSGVPLRAFYLIESGAFKAVRLGSDGQSQIMAFYFPREVMGLSAFAEQAYVSDLIALTPSVVHAIPASVLHHSPQPAQELLGIFVHLLSEQLARAEQDKLMLGVCSGTQKIASFLLDLQEKIRRADADPSCFDLPMTRQEIGSYLGMTMESISRLLSLLQEQDIVQVNKRHIRILREDQLRLWRDDGFDKAFSSRRQQRRA
ncbi:helix-turn-helix domain-containing protein [Acidithiobacillus sp.]|uniref:Crp/Fnr family transcriptional regulator n=1 Tax=Acidithiobacillus sp. TaxID=1872118 RepID=UPI0025BF752E|nr:helix-turn-helix domain-containing protein [Acidithiobacillus sp.]